MKSERATALFVTPHEPNIVGNGGNHRSYQIVHDLEALLGEHNVFVIYYYGWFFDWRDWNERSQHRQPRTHVLRVWRALQLKVQFRTRLRRLIANLRSLIIPKVLMIIAAVTDPTQKKVFASLYATSYESNQFSRPEFVDYYRHMLGQIKVDVVVIEYSGMRGIIDYNREHNIPTIVCPQNLEALGPYNPPETNVWTMYARLYDLATEYALFEHCDRRLFISKIETGIIQGLGCPSQFYPYRAVGQIHERMVSIRAEREHRPIEPGLYLMIGSAHHPPIGDGLRWFVREAAQYGLPEGVHVVVAGKQTDQLLPPGAEVPGLELKGWVGQAELDDLMLRVQGILVPYRMGFGALTRLSELPFTGIPVIASRFATYGIENEAGIFSVSNTWADWYDAMKRLKEGTLDMPPAPVEEERDRPSALQTAVRECLELERTPQAGV